LAAFREGAVKNWQETGEILAQVAGLAQAGRRAAVATVVRIRGSAYRRPGAKLLVRDDGGTSGGVSGGCLEADVRERALTVLRGAAPHLVHYETGSDDRQVFGLGLGCNGEVDVFVQQATTPAFLDAVRRIRECLAGDAPFAISTVLTGTRAGDVSVLASIRGGETAIDAPAGIEVFTEVLRPPPRLVLFGAGDDALPLARYAADAGFRVAVVDHRPAFLSAERFPGEVRRLELRAEDDTASSSLPLGRDAYAIVKTHSLAHDRDWVRRLVGSGVAYIGVLGPRARVEEILRQVGAAHDGRVFGPVGLDVGAEGPEQVAMSIVAELLAVRSGRAAGHLREREGAIHAP
jgi:xanthine/CO dehydrogenase XdhC/CoxF family maturation factor